MGRGRDKAVSDDRLLIELLVYPDRAVFSSELAEVLPVTQQTVRTRMDSLDEKGMVEVRNIDAGKVYRLTKKGREYLRDMLRDDYS